MTYKVVEIFDSIEGEGKRAGQTATFVRFAGCNLNCTYCDTTYANGNDYKIMSLEDIIRRIKERNFFRVTLTGGEPLTVYQIEPLILELLSMGIEVNIETNGSIDISTVLDYCKTYDNKLFFTIDYKLPSSGETDKMLLGNYKKLRTWDVLKFVVGSENDMLHLIDYVQGLVSQPLIYIGAVYDKYSLQKIVVAMLDEPGLKNANLQVQLHKIIWDPTERGV